MISPLQGLIGGLVLGLLIGAAGAWHFRTVEAERDMLELRATFDTAVIAASEQARTEERARVEDLAKLAEEARKNDTKIQDNAVASTAATGSLSSTATQYARAASCDTAATRRGASATRAAMVLSELLGESNRRASNLAKTADDARARGLTCERAWDAIRTPGKSG